MASRMVFITAYFALFWFIWFSGNGVKAAGDEKYFCNGVCEIERERCSCSTNCKTQRNCCTDYTESCDEGLSWKDTECTQSEEMVCPDGYKDKKYVIILSIDGYRDIYSNRNITQTITKLGKCGVSVPYMIPAYPTKTFPNHYTIVTGLYPESHGIIANRMYNHDNEEEFRLGRPSSFNSEWWKGEPIWVTTSNQGLKSAGYFWPGSDVNITRYPDYYFKYDESVDNEERVYQVLDWLDLPVEERPSLTVTYTHIVDTAGHTWGPQSELINRSLESADEMVEMLMNGLRDRKLDNCVNIIITSDHGMASVDCQDNVKYLEDYGINMTEVYFDGGPYGRIGKSKDKTLWDKFDAVETKKLLECKRDETHWEAYLKYEYLPKRFHYANDPWIEDLHLVMDDEWWLGGSSTSSSGCSPGGHGYDNTYQDMRAFFTGHGPAFKRGYDRSTPFESIELYNLFTEILQINSSVNNGTVGSIHDILATLPFVDKVTGGVEPSNCPYPENVNLDDRGCLGCENILESEANVALNLEPSEVTLYNSQHMLYGRPNILDDEADICVLTQRSYVTIYDNKLKIPRLISFVLDPENIWNTMLFRCTRRDIRLMDETITPCSEYKQQDGDITWNFLYHPSLADGSVVSDALISSNMVPTYEPFNEIWNFIGQQLNNWSNMYHGISVDVGPIFDYNFDGMADSRVERMNGSFTRQGDASSTAIPTHFFVVLTRCRDYRNSKSISECSKDANSVDVLSFIIPNYKDIPCRKEAVEPEDWIPSLLIRHVSRIRDVELLTKLSFLAKFVADESANQDMRLSAIRAKVYLPEPSHDWLKDFLSSVTPSPPPIETTTTSNGLILNPNCVALCISLFMTFF